MNQESIKYLFIFVFLAFFLYQCTSSKEIIKRQANHPKAWKIIKKTTAEPTPKTTPKEAKKIDEFRAQNKTVRSTTLLSDSLYKLSTTGKYGTTLICNRRDSVVYLTYGGDNKNKTAHRYNFATWRHKIQKISMEYNSLQLFPDSTKMILGKRAHKAVYSVDSVRYTAWYSKDFPSWFWQNMKGLHNLGIALETNFTINHIKITIKATSIKQVNLQSDDFTVPNDYRIVDAHDKTIRGSKADRKKSARNVIYNQKRDSLLSILQSSKIGKTYPSSSIFKDGYARITTQDSTFYVDQSGSYAFDKIIKANHPIDNVTSTRPGWIHINKSDSVKMLIVQKKGKMGLINSASGWVLPAKYTNLHLDFKRYLSLEKNGKLGYADTWGHIKVPAKFDKVNIMDGNYYDVKIGSRWGIYSAKKKKLIIQAKYDKFDFCGGCGGTVNYAYAEKNGKWGILGFDGTVLVPFKYGRHGHINMRGDEWVTNFEKDGKNVVINMDIDKVYGPPKYSDMEVVSGVLAAKKNGKYGLINAKGDIMLPFKYDDIGTPYSSLHYGPLLQIYQNEKCGIANNEGDIIIPPKTYDRIYVEGDYFGAYKDGQVALLDSTGKEIGPKGYDLSNWRYPYEVKKKDGRTVRLFTIQKDTLVGFYNLHSHTVVKPQFSNIRMTVTPDSSRHYVEVGKKGQGKGLYSLQGKALMPANYSYYQFMNDQFVKTQKKLKYGLYDLQRAKEIAPPVYDAVAQISDRYFFLKKSDSTTTVLKLWDQKKDRFSPIPFSGAKPAGYHLLIVHDSSNAYLYSLKKGKIISKPYSFTQTNRGTFVGIRPFEHGVARIEKNEKYGYLNPKGRVVVQPKYDRVSVNKHGIIRLNKKIEDHSWKYAFADTSGQMLTPFKYTINRDYHRPYLNLEDSQYIRISRFDSLLDKNLYGLINDSGKEIIPPKYDKIQPSLNENGVLVERNTHWGLFDEKGETIIPPVLDNVYFPKKAVRGSGKNIRFPILCELNDRYFYVTHSGNILPFRAEKRTSFMEDRGRYYNR